MIKSIEALLKKCQESSITIWPCNNTLRDGITSSTTHAEFSSNVALDEHYDGITIHYDHDPELLRTDTLCGYRIYLPLWAFPPGGPVVPIIRRTINTFQDLQEATQANVPFISRQMMLLHMNLINYIALTERQSRVAFGDHYSGGKEIPMHKAWDLYMRHHLDINISDAPVDGAHEILPNEWYEATKRLGDNALTFVVTQSPKTTPFHVDNGGTWMKLLAGEKIWWLIMPMDAIYLQQTGYNIDLIASMSMTRLLQIANGYLWGRIRACIISSGDFIWIPAGTLHRVMTTQDSHGFGGYL